MIRHVTFPVTPVAKPRMTQRDQWAKRPAVVRYRAYCDALRGYAGREGFELPDAGAHITFVIPMPPSWSKRKRAAMDGAPHQQKPDVDNLLKGLFDALRPDDAAIWQVAGMEKRWGTVGRVVIRITETEQQAA